MWLQIYHHMLVNLIRAIHIWSTSQCFDPLELCGEG